MTPETIEAAIAELFPDAKVERYSQVDSAPSHHGVFVQLKDGSRFEVSIFKK